MLIATLKVEILDLCLMSLQYDEVEVDDFDEVEEELLQIVDDCNYEIINLSVQLYDDDDEIEKLVLQIDVIDEIVVLVV